MYILYIYAQLPNLFALSNKLCILYAYFWAPTNDVWTPMEIFLQFQEYRLVKHNQYDWITLCIYL